MVITAHSPLCFVFVGGMGTQVNDTLGTTLIDGVQKREIAKACISSDDIQTSPGKRCSVEAGEP